MRYFEGGESEESITPRFKNRRASEAPKKTFSLEDKVEDCKQKITQVKALIQLALQMVNNYDQSDH